MTIQEKAINWFRSKGIIAYYFFLNNEPIVMIVVNGYEIQVDVGEVEYRAELWDLENN